MKKLTKIFAYFLTIFTFFFFNFSCLALEQEYPTIKGEKINIKTTLPELIRYFFKFALAIGGIVALTVIIIGGFRWMVSAAAPEQKKEAMDQIKAGIFGLLILLASYLILQTINPNLLKPLMPTLK